MQQRPPEYIEKYGLPKTPSELEKHKIILFREENNLLYPQNYTDWPLYMKTKFSSPRKPYMILNSLNAIFDLVVRGKGISSFATDSPLFQQKKLIKILPDELGQDIEVYYTYSNLRRSNSKILSFGKFLKEQANK